MENPFRAIERVIRKRYMRGASIQHILEYLTHMKSVWKYHVHEIDLIEKEFCQFLDDSFVL